MNCTVCGTVRAGRGGWGIQVAWRGEWELFKGTHLFEHYTTRLTTPEAGTNEAQTSKHVPDLEWAWSCVA